MGRDTPESLNAILKRLGHYEEVTGRLTRALKDELPHLARDGNPIRPGYHPPLDELLALRDDSKGALEALQQKYISEPGVASLKIRHNNCRLSP